MKLSEWLADNILEDEIVDFVSTGKVKSLLEANGVGSSEVDDGPTTFYKSYKDYEKYTKAQAEKMGMKVINFVIGENPLDNSYTNSNMPTYFPAGIPGESTPAGGKDYKFTKAYSLWRKRIKDIALLVGFEFLDHLEKKEIPSKTPSNDKIDEPTSPSKNPLTEAVKNEYAFKAIFLAGFGVDEFRVVLDETTTTPDLVDRNIMYAKVFIKPTRSIEFIALDFVITRSGASFDD